MAGGAATANGVTSAEAAKAARAVSRRRRKAGKRMEASESVHILGRKDIEGKAAGARANASLSLAPVTMVESLSAFRGVEMPAHADAAAVADEAVLPRQPRGGAPPAPRALGSTYFRAALPPGAEK